MNILFILTPLLAVASSHSWDWTNLTNETRLDQRGAEGPDALQVLIKAPMIVSDLGGLQSLAAAEPIKAQPLAPCLFAAKQSSPRPARAGGPDALQVPIKAPMAVFDLEGYGPSQPRNQ